MNPGVFKIAVAFSLTPALSRWEREQRPALFSFSSTRPANPDAGFVLNLDSFLPLPAGAATAAMAGEGECCCHQDLKYF